MGELVPFSEFSRRQEHKFMPQETDMTDKRFKDCHDIDSLCQRLEQIGGLKSGDQYHPAEELVDLIRRVEAHTVPSTDLPPELRQLVYGFIEPDLGP